MKTIYRVKKLAKERGRSIAYLCQKMGVARVYFNDIEKSGREIPIEKLGIISEALDTSIDYLLGKTDEKEKSPVASDEAVKVALFGGDTEVTEEMWQEVMNYAEYIKQKYRKT